MEDRFGSVAAQELSVGGKVLVDVETTQEMTMGGKVLVNVETVFQGGAVVTFVDSDGVEYRGALLKQNLHAHTQGSKYGCALIGIQWGSYDLTPVADLFSM